MTPSPTAASIKTFGKYLAWTAVAAGIQYAITNLTALNVPDLYVPIIGAFLKSAATYVSTQLKGV